ncbi:MAG: HisA/HisF-related TIM barrel protein [Sphingomicrobium sp.]
MILLPAIDLIDGRCVRLQQGDFARETSYSDDPEGALEDFAASDAREAHIVDLDGAKAGEPRQHALLIRLAAQQRLDLQVAGGLRTIAQVLRMLEAGVRRVVIGSLALSDPDAFTAILRDAGPDHVTLALDVRMENGAPIVATHGWQRGSGETLDEVLSRFPLVRHLLVTDIAKDGMLDGPNAGLMTKIAACYPTIELQASGGVTELSDLAKLRDCGAARAIVGKAIWERRFTVAEGVAHARS